MTSLATSTVAQDQSEGYPGYVPAAKSWMTKEDSGSLFAAPSGAGLRQSGHRDLAGLVTNALGRFRPVGAKRHAKPGRGLERLVPAVGVGVGDPELRPKRRLPSREQVASH